MLVLFRRAGDTILIGNEIVITVVGLDRGRVRIGTRAPPHVRIDREEVLLERRNNPAFAKFVQPGRCEGMLILTRRSGQVVCIGEDIKVVVLGIQGLAARIGIEAPKNVIILREELCGQERAAKYAANDDRGNVIDAPAVAREV